MIDFRVGYIQDDITIVCWNKIDLSAEEVCVISGQRDEVQFFYAIRKGGNVVPVLDFNRIWGYRPLWL